MSKYIKLEDAIDARCPVEYIWEDCIDCPLNDSGIDPCKMGKWLKSLPTIEVSEDCISKHDIWKIIEDNAYWVRCNENSTEKGMTLTGINQALNECPPVIPTVSEDCISREYLKSLGYINKGDFNSVETIREWIDNAPSVIPKKGTDDE